MFPKIPKQFKLFIIPRKVIAESSICVAATVLQSLLHFKRSGTVHPADRRQLIGGGSEFLVQQANTYSGYLSIYTIRRSIVYLANTVTLIEYFFFAKGGTKNHLNLWSVDTLPRPAFAGKRPFSIFLRYDSFVSHFLFEHYLAGQLAVLVVSAFRKYPPASCGPTGPGWMGG